MLCSWMLVINILRAIFYFIKITLAAFKLFTQVRLHNNIKEYRNLEKVHIDVNTSTNISVQ